MSENDTASGGCQCGRIRYSVALSGDRVNDAAFCHCRMCQRATGGVAAALKQVKRDAVTWEREPDRYRSSPIAQRGFCSACGTPLTYEGDDSDEMDLTVGSFDDPYRFRLAAHAGVESRHDKWFAGDDLPAFRTDQIEKIAAKWKEAGGSVPD